MEDFGDWNESDVVDLIRSIGDHAETAVLERKTIMVYTSF